MPNNSSNAFDVYELDARTKILKHRVSGDIWVRQRRYGGSEFKFVFTKKPLRTIPAWLGFTVILSVLVVAIIAHIPSA